MPLTDVHEQQALSAAPAITSSDEPGQASDLCKAVGEPAEGGAVKECHALPDDIAEQPLVQALSCLQAAQHQQKVPAGLQSTGCESAAL